MMLPGRLGATTLGDVLGALHRERASGTVELVEDRGTTAGRVHRLFVAQGLIEAVETPLRAVRLGELLGQHGWLNADAARWLYRRLIESPGRRTGELLLERGLVTPDVLAAALRRQLRARLEALFTLGDACVRFHVPRPSARRGEATPLSPREFLYGRPRARDRSRRASAPPNRQHVPPGTDRQRALRTLGLEREVDRPTMMRVFRGLAVRFHPDRHPEATPDERDALIRRFAEISAAYHLLLA
jgi:hypothetical protein